MKEFQIKITRTVEEYSIMKVEAENEIEAIENVEVFLLDQGNKLNFHWDEVETSHNFEIIKYGELNRKSSERIN